MTATQYREIIEQLGLTQIAAGRLLDYNGRTSRRWASGTSPIPTPVAVLLRLLARRKISERDIKQAKDQPRKKI